MYKLLNLIFGWDYVAYQNYWGYGVRRVRSFPDGTVGIWIYSDVLQIISKPAAVHWLTCKPEKYFGGK